MEGQAWRGRVEGKHQEGLCGGSGREEKGGEKREFGESRGLDPTGPYGQQGCLTFSLNDMRAITGF